MGKDWKLELAALEEDQFEAFENGLDEAVHAEDLIETKGIHSVASKELSAPESLHFETEAEKHLSQETEDDFDGEFEYNFTKTNVRNIVAFAGFFLVSAVGFSMGIMNSGSEFEDIPADKAVAMETKAEVSKASVNEGRPVVKGVLTAEVK